MSHAILRAGQHQLAAIRPHHLALLADGPLHERAALVDAILVEACGEDGIAIVLLEARDRVVRDLATLDGPRTDLDGAHPPRLVSGPSDDRLATTRHCAPAGMVPWRRTG